MGCGMTPEKLPEPLREKFYEISGKHMSDGIPKRQADILAKAELENMLEYKRLCWWRKL